MRSSRPVRIVSCLLLALAGCTAPQPSARISPAPPTPKVRSLPTASEEATGAGDPAGDDAVLGPAPADLRAVRWRAATIPADFCDVGDPVTLTRGSAEAMSSTWGPVVVTLFDVDYGDLAGDPREEAALRVDCNNGGGTASGILRYGIVVVANVDGELTALGSLVAQRQPPAQLPTTLVIKEWRPDALTVEELWYRPGDATCCPSGVAEVTWTWRDGVPTPGPAHVLQ